jgi:general secretion pathway protein D
MSYRIRKLRRLCVVAERDIKKLDSAFEGQMDPPKGESRAEGLSAQEKVLRPSVPAPVDINYPDPTHLSHILKDVAKWSGLSFVMEPAANVRLQIFAASKLPPHQAYELFLASLSVVGLRAVQIGKVVKIVPITLVVSA